MAAKYPPTKRFHFVDDVSDQVQALLECFGVIVSHSSVQLPPQTVLVSELLDRPTNGDITTIYRLEGMDIRIIDRPAFSDLTISQLPKLVEMTLGEDCALMDICYLDLMDEVRAHGIVPECDYVDDYEPDDCDPLQWSEELES